MNMIFYLKVLPGDITITVLTPLYNTYAQQLQEPLALLTLEKPLGWNTGYLNPD